MYGDNVTFAQAAVVCVFSMAVVFIVLLAISYMIDIIAYFVNRKSKKAVKTEPAQEVSRQEPSEPHPDHIDVVLVTAAVAAYLGKRTDEIVVRSIRKIGTEETTWSRAGRIESMQ